jgi:UDP-N-acetyl-D-galactosamine dehydrogenase
MFSRDGPRFGAPIHQRPDHIERNQCVGFFANACRQSRVDELMSGHDSTLEVEDDLLQEAIQAGRTGSVGGLTCTTDIEVIRDCNFYVVAVPTPVDKNNNPDLRPL